MRNFVLMYPRQINRAFTRCLVHLFEYMIVSPHQEKKKFAR